MTENENSPATTWTDTRGWTHILTDVERYGEAGWSWTSRVEDPDDPDYGVTQDCRTDGDGQGLWVRSLDDGSWSQTYGTTQYRLTGQTVEQAVAQIKSPTRRHS